MTGIVARLDDYGRPAWITAMVLGFVLFWPAGLAILAYMIWSGRMGCTHYATNGNWQQARRARWQRKIEHLQEKMAQWSGQQSGGFQPTGNRAFDEYRNAMLKRLEEEADEFHSFLERLRMARDKAEFDQFVAERRGMAEAGRPNPPRGQEPDAAPST